jgi:predicted metal-dependent HD superfamily phosphohydrolase
MNKVTLKSIWQNLLDPITTEFEAEKEWDNILGHYTQSHRHYHTLQHLEDMYAHISVFYNQAIPLATLLALFYHDFKYNPLRSDNEQQSALYAEQKLTEWHAPQQLIDTVAAMILATKEHESNIANTEIAVFLDADLAILGVESKLYQQYCAQVRMEFNVYPDFLYRKGRKAFLEATLHKPCIFSQAYFFNQFEQQARLNLEHELKQLL